MKNRKSGKEKKRENRQIVDFPWDKEEKLPTHIGTKRKDSGIKEIFIGAWQGIAEIDNQRTDFHVDRIVFHDNHTCSMRVNDYKDGKWDSYYVKGKFENSSGWVDIAVNDQTFKVRYKLHGSDSLALYYKDIVGIFIREIFDQDANSSDIDL